MTPDKVEAALESAQDVIERISRWDKAYPTDMFPEVTEEDRKWMAENRPTLMSRIGASMGRHISNCIRHDLEALSEALSVLTEALAERERDAARLDWLDSQSADGVHLEVCHKGSWAEGDLVKTATVFIGRKEFTARNSRIAIDAAMKETP